MLDLHSTFSQLQNTSTRQYGPLQYLRGSSATLSLLSRLSCTKAVIEKQLLQAFEPRQPLVHIRRQLSIDTRLLLSK
jgi:hypothetical protein